MKEKSIHRRVSPDKSMKRMNVRSRIRSGCFLTAALIVTLTLQAGCMAISILPGAELSIPPQSSDEKERLLQLNIIAGENEFGAINLGGYNESQRAMLNVGVFNRSVFSALSAGLANQTVLSAVNVGIANQTGYSGLQVGLIFNSGWSFVNIAPVNVGGGLQIGLVNWGTSAIQLGLINFCDEWILPIVAYCGVR